MFGYVDDRPKFVDKVWLDVVVDLCKYDITSMITITLGSRFTPIRSAQSATMEISYLGINHAGLIALLVEPRSSPELGYMLS